MQRIKLLAIAVSICLAVVVFPLFALAADGTAAPPAMPHVGWIAIAAFLVGLIVRGMKSDGMKVALANLGLPPIPTRALPWLALALGGVAAVLDAKVAGAGWDAAAQAGVMAAALAVFGHELGSGLPGVKKVLGVALLLIPLSTTSCALFNKQNAPGTVDLIADKTKCALTNLDLPFEAIVVKCLLTAEDIPRVLPLFTAAKDEAQRAATAAREDERAKLRASGCSDAGAPVDASDAGAR